MLGLACLLADLELEAPTKNLPQFFTPQNRPVEVQEAIQKCYPEPDMGGLDPFATAQCPAPVRKQISNPDFFFEEWRRQEADKLRVLEKEKRLRSQARSADKQRRAARKKAEEDKRKVSAGAQSNVKRLRDWRGSVTGIDTLSLRRASRRPASAQGAGIVRMKGSGMLTKSERRLKVSSSPAVVVMEEKPPTPPKAAPAATDDAHVAAMDWFSFGGGTQVGGTGGGASPTGIKGKRQRRTSQMVMQNRRSKRNLDIHAPAPVEEATPLEEAPGEENDELHAPVMSQAVASPVHGAPKAAPIEAPKEPAAAPHQPAAPAAKPASLLDQIRAGKELKSAAANTESAKPSGAPAPGKPLSLLDQIKAGKSLKSAAARTPRPAPAGRPKPMSLLDEIKAGKNLKKVDKEDEAKRRAEADAERPKPSGALSLEDIMAKNRMLLDPESSSDEDDSGSDWSDD